MEPDVLAVADGVVLDQQAERIRWHGIWLELSSVQYRGLKYLVEHRGTPISGEELAQAVWGGEVARRQAQTLVRRLRARLEEDARRPRIILTVVGEGYMVPA